MVFFLFFSFVMHVMYYGMSCTMSCTKARHGKLLDGMLTYSFKHLWAVYVPIPVVILFYALTRIYR